MGGASPSGGVDSGSDAHGDASEVGTDVAPAAKSKWPSRIGLIAGALVAIGAVVAMMDSEPRPDATLHPLGVEPDDQLITQMTHEGLGSGPSNPPGFGSEQVIDLSSLRGFGTYQDIEVWSAVNAFESTCLIAFHRETVDVVARQCVPAGVDLFMDTDEHGLPEGERLRFFLRGDTVDAYHLVPEEAG